MEIVVIRKNVLIGGWGLLIVTGAFAEATNHTLPECSAQDRDVEVLSRQEPYYPHSAQMFCVTGRVKAAFTIDRQGKPKDIEILESKPEGIFDRSTVETIEQWRFIPACREGERAEREAVQTINFRLPDAAGQTCAEAVGQLDDRTADLLGEIGARYALLAEYWRTGAGGPAVKSALEAPFSDFSGDLARVATFHRRSLEAIVQNWRGPHVNRLFSEAVVALMPDSLEDDRALEQARERFERSRSAFDKQRERARRVHEELSAAYRRLERDTRMDNETLTLLVEPFTGDPEVSFEQTIQPVSKSIGDLERVLTFLESKREEWRIVDNEVRFDREDDLVTYQALWEDFLEHRHRLETEALNSMRSFEDYAD